MEMEAAGSLAVAGLMAHQLDGGTEVLHKNGHHANGHARCLNCDTAMGGEFCTSCGQRAHVHKSLLHLGEEFLHGPLHFDAKGWRTLPLLVLRPGQLTRRYIDGQRTRFVSPLVLFLFMVFLMFFVATMTSGDTKINLPKGASSMSEARRELIEDKEKSLKQVASAEAALKTASAAGADPDEAQRTLDKARARRCGRADAQGL